MKSSPSTLAGRRVRHSCAASACPSAGLTLIEVLAIVVIVGILCAMLMPVGGGSQRPRGFGCLNNLKQLQLGWWVYASDNGDRVVPTGGISDTAENSASSLLTNNNWVHGRMDRPISQTNEALIAAGGIFPYTKNAKFYKCPSDKKLDPNKVPTVRSVAMNCWFNPLHSWNDSSGLPPVRVLGTSTDVGAVWGTNAPANTWVMIDQSPEDINDGWFVVNVARDATRLKWVDRPATYHNGAGGISFADGHAEIRKWSGKNSPAAEGNTGVPADVQDLRWLSARSSVPAD